MDGKVRALSKLLRDNFGFVLQGAGIVVPIFATYDSGAEPPRGSIFTTQWARNLKWPIMPHGLGVPGGARDSLLRKQNWGKNRSQARGR